MDDLSSLLKAELISLCEEHGLKTNGTKSVLIERINDHLYSEETTEEVVEEKVKVSKGNMNLPNTDPMAMSAEDFVEAAYQAILGREADVGGRKHYLRAINPLGSLTRQGMLDTLLASDEYKEKHS